MKVMKLHVKFLFVACVIGTILGIQPIICDELSSASGISRWTCTCFSSYRGNNTFTIATRCSRSCNCNPGDSSEGRWTCICDADGFPKMATNVQDASCFIACNCTFGSIGKAHATKNSLTSKLVVVILLLCVTLTTSAFIASMVCYLHQSNKCPIQVPMFSSDKESSCNSSTNLIRITSVPEFKINIESPIIHISGCFRKPCSLLRSRSTIICETITQFSYSDLENATQRFSSLNLLGIGGSSCVYRGHLKDGRTVAVKRFKTQGGPEEDYVFLREIELLSRLHHRHVVPLLGYCTEYQGKHAERLLVFEYMPNGNLRDYIDGVFGKDLEWGTRVAIALGAARGLEYLHEAAKPRILHRDVKSTNILLDENWEAKITDLGMAKHLQTDDVPSCTSSPARLQGTFGYFAPEYVDVGRASLKSDVFSFGVVLLELISGRQPIQKSADNAQESLVLWATSCLIDSRRVISELPDLRLKGNFPEEEMQVMAYLAKECLLLDPDSRPTMTDVVQILSSIAPSSVRRGNFSINYFKSSLADGRKGELGIKRCNKQVEVHLNTEGTRQATVKEQSARCSLPLSVDRTLCFEKMGKGGNISREYIERLVSLTSTTPMRVRRRVQEDEIVDLTEPRFETFHLYKCSSKDDDDIATA